MSRAAINPALGTRPPIQLFRLILTLAAHLRTRMDQRLAEIGLTTQQAAVLTLAEASEQAPTLGDIAHALGSTHQNARQIVGALERKGLVAVMVDPDDRRARRVTPTRAVASLFAGRTRSDHGEVARWMSVLRRDEQRVAVELLNRLLVGLMERAE